MGWFGRKRSDGKDNAATPGAEGADSSLTFFSVDEAAQFRALVREVAAERGREVSVHADHIVDDAGNVFGLWNVAALCASESDGAWRGLVDTHVDHLFNPQGPDVATMDLEALMASVHARLVEEDSLRSFDDLDAYSLEEWAPGVRRILAVDTPTTVLTPALDHLKARAPLATLIDQGWRNTRSLLDTEPLSAERVEHDGRWFTCLLGDSFFTASLALMLSDVAARFEPEAVQEHGIIFAIPYRHQLAFRVATDAEAALAGLMLIPRFAANCFSESPGPISPCTFHWRDGVVSCLTEMDGQGQLTVRPGPYLERLLSELG